jgi:hypothetical protein
MRQAERTFLCCLMLYPDSTEGPQTAPQTLKKFFWDMLFGYDDLIGFPGFSGSSGFSEFSSRSSAQDRINLRRPN